MGIQTITTPAGDEMVIMPRAEYEALVTAAEEAFEDGADAATYTAASAGIVLDYDADRRIVGLEVLDARAHLSPDLLNRAA